MSEWKTICEGWRIILRFYQALLTRLIEKLKRRRDGRKRSERDYKDVRCLTPPNDIRARPDPFVYSQQWLKLRNLAFVWDNPDFRLIDVATGLPVDRHDLQPNKDYDIDVTIHNSSFMAAIGTQVRFEVRRFGAGTAIIDDLGVDVVHVPGLGTALARKRWRTPETGGHNCLRAIITHHDDANPLNNVGQHNTDVARPASPTRLMRFLVGNEGATPKAIRILMDAYRLPRDVRCPDTFGLRNSLQYLRRLQGEHDRRKFPVPEYLRVQLSQNEVSILPGAEVEITLEMNPAPRGSGTHSVNVNAYDGAALVGGITVYVAEEGAE